MKTKFNYTYLYKEQFIRAILSGERNLSRVFLYRFDHNSNLLISDFEKHPYFPGFLAYLEEQEEELKTNPIRLGDSNLVGLIAPGLYFPFTRGRGVNFTGANLKGANLTRAYFNDSNFNSVCLTNAVLGETNFTNTDLSNSLCINTDSSYARFRNANLKDVDFKNANLIGADFRGANLDGTNFDSAKLAKVDIRGAKNLEHALNLYLDAQLEIRADTKELGILNQIAANH